MTRGNSPCHTPVVQSEQVSGGESGACRRRAAHAGGSVLGRCGAGEGTAQVPSAASGAAARGRPAAPGGGGVLWAAIAAVQDAPSAGRARGSRARQAERGRLGREPAPHRPGAERPRSWHLPGGGGGWRSRFRHRAGAAVGKEEIAAGKAAGVLAPAGDHQRARPGEGAGRAHPAGGRCAAGRRTPWEARRPRPPRGHVRVGRGPAGDERVASGEKALTAGPASREGKRIPRRVLAVGGSEEMDRRLEEMRGSTARAIPPGAATRVKRARIVAPADGALATRLPTLVQDPGTSRRSAVNPLPDECGLLAAETMARVHTPVSPRTAYGRRGLLGVPFSSSPAVTPASAMPGRVRSGSGGCTSPGRVRSSAGFPRARRTRSAARAEVSPSRTSCARTATATER